MTHYYRHENQHEPAPRAHSPKRNPFQTPSQILRDFPGNPACPPGADYSPSRIRAHLDRKQTSNHDSDQSLLEMLNSTVACLKQKNMDLEALGCLEQSLWLKRRMFGVDNSVVHKALNEVMLSYNSVAMQYLAQGQFDQCLAMLRKAEAITAPGNFKRCQALQILTFNNIGCCYRKLGKLKSALKYLKEAAQIGSGSAHVKNLSITHLNLCAIQSQLGRHDLALEHAQAAIFHTQEELVSLEDEAGNERDEDVECDGDDRDQAALVNALDPKTREEKIISRAVAYHNLAVELEFNGRGEASLQWYKKALQLVWKYRETNEALCESFKKIFLDAKKKQQTAYVRQNGIPASACTGNSSGNARRPMTRPRSAHASSRCANEGDVSYSSTVASHCYKATKPSTAGLRYGSPRSAASGRGGKPQRPSSATTRQRPMSAKVSTRPNYRNTSQGSRESAEDAFESHWKKLEKEHALNDFQTPPMAPSKTERRTRRPQSAGSATAAARRRNPVPMETQRRQKLQGQLYFAAKDDEFIGNDEDYGVILDDGDCDDGFDNYPGAALSDCCNNRQETEADSRASAKFQNGRMPNAKGQRSSRHRRALDDSRSQASLDQSEPNGDSDSVASSSRGAEENSPGASLTGYSGDDDTDPDLPAKRVGHMEYLRRMKKLAESIKDDLSGVGARPSTLRPAELVVNLSPAHRQEEINSVGNELESGVSTPRSATSKLRDRIEQARRDSFNEAGACNGKSDQVQAVALASENQTTGDDDGIDLVEDVNVFESEAEARDAELQLFRVAAGGRLQAFFRGQRCRTEVNQLKQVKLENESASLIQHQARQYLEMLKEEKRLQEERLQLDLQKEEVEDMAACLIQRLCRRALSRKPTSVAKRKDEGDIPSPSPQRRPFSIADVVLGAAVNKSVGSIQTLLDEEERLEPSRLNSAATVPRLNLSQAHQPEETCRSVTVSPIAVSTSDGVEAPPKEPTEASSRSDVYDGDEDWKPAPSRSGQSTPRTARSTRIEVSSPSRLTAVTPHCSFNAPESETLRQNAATVRIQALVKGFCVRQRIALANAGDMSRSYIEQRHFSVALDRALEQEQSFLEELSAVKIQAQVRGRQSRLLTECLKAGVYTAASTIQRSFRLHRHNTQRAVDEGVRSIAARAIQQVYRDYEARRTAIHQAAVQQELVSVQQIAAITIQNFWKQYFTTRDHCLEEIEAATCIQALGRGHLTRKSMKSLHGSSSSGLSKHSSAFSMSSSAEKLVEEDESGSDRKEKLNINYSFLPASIRELYVSSGGIQPPTTNTELHAEEIAELGLTFSDFLRELETCTDLVVCSSALDAMRIVVETAPQSSKTLANVVKVAQNLDRRLQEGFWNEAIEASSIALLHTFRDVLDAQ